MLDYAPGFKALCYAPPLCRKGRVQSAVVAWALLNKAHGAQLSPTDPRIRGIPESYLPQLGRLQAVLKSSTFHGPPPGGANREQTARKTSRGHGRTDPPRTLGALYDHCWAWARPGTAG